jgi:hypothetical protein
MRPHPRRPNLIMNAFLMNRHQNATERFVAERAAQITQRLDIEQVFYINKSQRKSRRVKVFFRFVGASIQPVIAMLRIARCAGSNCTL